MHIWRTLLRLRYGGRKPETIRRMRQHHIMAGSDGVFIVQVSTLTGAVAHDDFVRRVFIGDLDHFRVGVAGRLRDIDANALLQRISVQIVDAFYGAIIKADTLAAKDRQNEFTDRHASESRHLDGYIEVCIDGADLTRFIQIAACSKANE